ncbi:MAG: hypothetical protein ACPLSY_03685 [Moorellaceae bacterium]
MHKGVFAIGGEKVIRCPVSKLSIHECLERAKHGELQFFWASYGSGGLLFKAVCGDAKKLKGWLCSKGLTGVRVFDPGTALPSATMAGKAARRALAAVLGGEARGGAG